ncbi:hypothetical protein [Roseomonas sp. KE2513]|nr:hypothetical protein [Roseomonas sp. KE2513]
MTSSRNSSGRWDATTFHIFPEGFAKCAAKRAKGFTVVWPT